MKLPTSIRTWIFICLVCFITSAAVFPLFLRPKIEQSLVQIRDRCATYSLGHAPTDKNARTITQGLWKQSPWNPIDEIDLASSGFSLALLPSNVENGQISRAEGTKLASEASARVLDMVNRSAAATSREDILRFGYRGMLYHYASWSPQEDAFVGNPGTEISSIDTAILMYGLLICAQYFGEDVAQNYAEARDKIDWLAWYDRSREQFHMAYDITRGHFGHWDWYSHETLILVLFAAMSDDRLDPKEAWNGWRRERKAWAAPNGSVFETFTTWNGDPFTVLYALPFFDFDQLGPDINGVYWWEEGRTAYAAHLAYFEQTQGFAPGMSYAFTAGWRGPIAEPKSYEALPQTTQECALYSIAGGLLYGGKNLEKNLSAQVLTLLASKPKNFYMSEGWPFHTFDAVDQNHFPMSTRVVGQDLSFISLCIDTLFTERSRKLVSADPKMRRVLDEIFPKSHISLNSSSPETNLSSQASSNTQALPRS